MEAERHKLPGAKHQRKANSRSKATGVGAFPRNSEEAIDHSCLDVKGEVSAGTVTQGMVVAREEKRSGD